MERLRETRCVNDSCHAAGSRKCKDCGSLVQARCNECGSWKASASIADHERRCEKKKKKRTAISSVRVAYVPPSKERGRYFFEEAEEFARSLSWLKMHRVNDDAIGGFTVNAYDAVFAKLEAMGSLSIIVLDTNVIEMIKEMRRLQTDIHILVWPNWMFECNATDLRSLVEWVELLRQYECVCDCKVFPPIDYCVLFGRKELWTRRMLAESQASLFKMIPTVFMFDRQAVAAGTLDAFAKEHKRLVFKRSLSEGSEYVFDNVSIVKRQVKNGPSNLESFPYLVQPYMKEFDVYPEMRIYILNGAFLFGVESKWRRGVLEFKALLDQDAVVIQAAIQVVRALSEARPFARVDLIQQAASPWRWWLNEIEFFGGADLLFPVAGNQRNLLEKLAIAVQQWINAV